MSTNRHCTINRTPHSGQTKIDSMFLTKDLDFVGHNYLKELLLNKKIKKFFMRVENGLSYSTTQFFFAVFRFPAHRLPN